MQLINAVESVYNHQIFPSIYSPKRFTIPTTLHAVQLCLYSPEEKQQMVQQI